MKNLFLSNKTLTTTMAVIVFGLGYAAYSAKSEAVIPLPKFGETQQVATVLSCTVTKWNRLELKQINARVGENKENTSFALDFVAYDKFTLWESVNSTRILQLLTGRDTVVNNNKLQISQIFSSDKYGTDAGKVTFLATKLPQEHRANLGHGIDDGDYLIQISGSGESLEVVKKNLLKVFPEFHPSVKNPLKFYCSRVAGNTPNQ